MGNSQPLEVVNCRSADAGPTLKQHWLNVSLGYDIVLLEPHVMSDTFKEA